MYRLEKEIAVKTSEVVSAWGKILKGERPSLSIEITRECPLQCPGCYAYDDAHLGGGATLRSLNDRKGQELIDGVLELVDRLRPLHLSLVGGDPLVRYRELESMIPQLLDRGIHVQVVTSAFRPLAASWAGLPHLYVVVSIDGLQPEHDIRRAPATYDRILKNIAGQCVTIHCTVTGQRSGGSTPGIKGVTGIYPALYFKGIGSGHNGERVCKSPVTYHLIQRRRGSVDNINCLLLDVRSIIFQRYDASAIGSGGKTL